MICDFCEHEMEEIDREVEQFGGDYMTPPDYKTIWIEWWCPYCGDDKIEFYE